jgi:O-antigen/teichoic acid export membrane protein
MKSPFGITKLKVKEYLADILPELRELYPLISRLRRYLADPLRRNALFLMAANVVAPAFGFFFWLIVARFYPTEQVGLATALISAMALLAIISMLGFNIGLIRFLPHSENKRDMINSCLTIAGLFSIVVAIIFILGLNLWSPKLLFIRENWIYFLAFILFTLAITLSQLIGQVFIAFRATHFTFIQSIINGIRLVLPALLVAFGTFGIFASWGLASALALITGVLFILKLYPKYRPIPTIRKRIVNEMAHFSVGNYVASIFSALPMYIMPLIIIAVLTTESSAYFYIPFTVASILGMVASSTGFSLLAEGSYEPAQLRSQVIKAAKFILLFLIPGVVLLFFLSNPILSLFGADYAQNSLWLLRLFAIGYLPVTITTLYLTIIRVQKRIKPLIYVSGFIAVFTIVAGYLLMNSLGLIGVGIAWLSAQTIVALVVAPIMLKMAGISMKEALRLKKG